ncbi:reverse transcriptase domain-containing protein [Tanacetum coccineum]
MVQEQWVDTVNHDGKWTKKEEVEDSNEALAVSFYPRIEPVEPIEWKAQENRLKPSSVEPSKLELKELPEHLEYDFLQENNQLPVVISSALSTVVLKKGGMTVVKNDKDELIPQRTVTGWRIPIAPEDQEKTTFTCPYVTFAYKRIPFGLCNAPSTFQRCMTTIFHELIEDSMEVVIDDFSIFGSSFDHCLKNLEKMLKRCEETNLVLNWEKCHFMVKEGIVLGHKVSGSGIEDDKSKIKSISKLPYPTNVKAIRSFLGYAGFYRRFIKYFSHSAHPMTQLLVKDFPFNFSKECIQAFDTLKRELTSLCPAISLHKTRCKTTVNSMDPSALRIRYRDLGPSRGHHGIATTARKVFEAGFYWTHIFRDARKLVQVCDACQRAGNISSSEIHLTIDYVSKWVEAQAFPTNDAQNIVNFLKRLFAQFGIPKALISDRGTHFCNHQMEKAMKRKDWSYKLDDALWAFRTAFKTPLGTTPFRIIYGKHAIFLSNWNIKHIGP